MLLFKKDPRWIVPLSFTFALTANAQTEQPQTLVVKATAPTQSSLLSPSYQQEKDKLDNVAGGTNLTLISKASRQATLSDILDYQPGIVIQHLFGGLDQPRLSIRGSGAQSAPLSRGVLLLQDGLPMNDADGSFHSSMLDVRDARMASVRRGANSLNLQSNSLGGELDLLSYTGRNEQGRLRYEAGSFGRQGVQAALGNVSDDGRFDARLSMTYDHFDGYRDHSASQRKTVHSNVGFIADNFENRTWLSWTDLRFDVPGPLALQDLEDHPKQTQKIIGITDPHRNTQQMRVANKSIWTPEDQEISVGLWYIQTHDNFNKPTTVELSNNYTKGAQFTYQLETQLVTYRAAAAWDHMVMKREIEKNAKNPKLPAKLPQKVGYIDGRAENLYASLGAGIHFSDALLLNLDLKGTHARRDASSRDGKQTLNQSADFLTPKAGIIWSVTPEQRLFANLSMSKEPATFNDIIIATPKAVKLVDLDPQRAKSIEFGGEGQVVDGMNWALTFYRSLIKDEYIFGYENGVATDVANYDHKTRHQGVEAGLNGHLPVAVGQFDYRFAWTYNDARFMGGEYNRNYIAGIPRNVISGEILYRIGDWRFGPNLHWSPTDMAVDHNNSFDVQKAKRFALLGFSADYRYKNAWSVYLMLDNITDKRYAASTLANPTATQKQPNGDTVPAALMFPGSGFSVNGGITYTF